MKLYTKDGQSVSLKNSIIYSAGACGTIYKTSEDKCIKVFKNTDDSDRLEKIVKFIKTIDNDGIYSVYQTFYNKQGEFQAFERSFCDEEKIDLLTTPSEFIVENYINLMKLSNILSNEGIKMYDVNHSNVIVNSQKITIIDAGLFCYAVFGDSDSIKTVNDRVISSLICSLIGCSYTRYHFHEQFNKSIYRDFAQDEVIRKLTRYKYPIDYLRK